MIRRLPFTNGREPHDEAARLHARLDETGSEADRLEAEGWQARSPVHQAAYEDVESLLGLARSHGDDPAIRTLRSETLHRVAARGSNGWERLAAASLACVLVLGSAWFLNRSRPEPATPAFVPQASLYKTEIGERLTVALADGSRATLNTASRVRVIYTPAERRILLDSGEAYFQVAKDPARPFRVFAIGHSITAYGTEFDVRVDRGRLEVALLEGKVGVAGPGRSIGLTRRQLLIASNSGLTVRAIGDESAVTAWSQGLVTFDDETVAEAAAEMNRYLVEPIVIADPRLARTRISGTFHTGEADAFIEALGYYVPTQRTLDRNGRIVLTRG